jgi:hypothetical protein
LARKSACCAGETPPGLVPARSPTLQIASVVDQPISVSQIGLSSPLASIVRRTSR